MGAKYCNQVKFVKDQNMIHISNIKKSLIFLKTLDVTLK